MTDEFRAAFQRVLDTAASQAPAFPAAVHDVFRLSSQVPVEELAIAMEALAPVLGDSEPVAGIAADLAVLAGALVEAGAPAGQVGLEVLRQLGSYGQAAVAFMHAWDKTGGGQLPAPNDVSAADEQRVEEVLGDNAPLATVGWWTSLRYGLAAKAMLGDPEVRAAVRADSSALEGLTQIVHALSTQLSEFVEVNELLRMAEAGTLLVLDRTSRRGFRVRFDGIGDNFQLHTLLADALIGKEGRLVPGTRPDPRWTAACLDAPVDPLADVVRGEWDLVGGDGTWVGNEAYPGDIPLVEGTRVLVLEPQSLSHSWRAGRRHPHIPGSLEVLEELRHEDAAVWWTRIHLAGSVRHPMAPPIEHDETGTHRTQAPRHFGVAAHFAEVDSGPMSASFRSLEPETDDGLFPGESDAAPAEPQSPPEPWGTSPEDRGGSSGTDAPGPHPWAADPLPSRTRPEPPEAPRAGDPIPDPLADPLADPLSGPQDPWSSARPEDPWSAAEPAEPLGAWRSPEPLDSWTPAEPEERREQAQPWPLAASENSWSSAGPAEPLGDWRSPTEPGGQPGQEGRDQLWSPSASEDPLGAWDQPETPEDRGTAGPSHSLDPEDSENTADAEKAADAADIADSGDGRRPGSRLLPPMPPGVSDSWAWAPGWKWPAPPGSSD
ncbi:hypothetical protein [Nocardiopsis alborubida]|uniref:Uncharacterized protein n=1 Tax=Nocardiopsis alborubida TaxID=146802 RepID=A0A7X6MHP2_9ACTN|nr:hypothetical protein [Nocardiopsis alborubida]NKZ00685.1 hypothetical protein [Nocardiopsis alborubida]